MGKHEAPEPKRSLRSRLARHALHPAIHIITLVALHTIALVVIDKTPLLALMFLH
jgi:hypothetical protein